MAEADTVSPLCTAGQFSEGAFGDLVADYDSGALADDLLEATRRCEDIADRRLAPFTGVTETLRAAGMDPDEYAGSTNLPLDIKGTLGMSYADQLGVSGLVRHTWLREYPPRLQDLWTTPGQATMAITVVRSYGGIQQLYPAQILDGPDDTGHVWFQLGQFIPVASRLRITYSGGYQTIPASLVRACKYMTASIVIRELNPESVAHNPDQLEAQAERWMKPWVRGGGT